jgi:purine-cytosine permease-like protein
LAAFQSRKSLSLATLGMQMPGALMVVIFQAMNNADFTTWTPFLLSAVQQFILILLCLFFMYKERQQEKANQRVGGLLLEDNTTDNQSIPLDDSYLEPESSKYY